MSQRGPNPRHVIPVLTEVVAARSGDTETEPADNEALEEFESQLAELQTRLSSSTYELLDRLLHSAFKEMEAALFEQVSNRLRQELPELVDRILREQLPGDTGDPDD